MNVSPQVEKLGRGNAAKPAPFLAHTIPCFTPREA